MDNLQSLTVSKLKEKLRDQGKKVSGTKKELILRLKEGEEEKFLNFDDDSKPVVDIDSVSTPKKRIICTRCSQILKIPGDYEGYVKCPQCGHRFKKSLRVTFEMNPFTKQLLIASGLAFLIAIISFWNMGEICLFGCGMTDGWFGFLISGIVSIAIGSILILYAFFSSYKRY
jgi:DNA-directed RNA polymerase subunit RPC12/RpoP